MWNQYISGEEAVRLFDYLASFSYSTDPWAGIGFGWSWYETPSDVGHIKEIDCSNMGISVIPENIKHLHGLKKLNLSNNRLTQLPVGFYRLYNLETIDLSNNKFRTIDKDICFMKNVRELDLSSNCIERLPKLEKSFFSYESEIECLKLGGNPFSTLPESINQLKKLEILDLSDMTLQELPESIYDLNLPFLKDKGEKGIILDNSIILGQNIEIYLSNDRESINSSSLLKELRKEILHNDDKNILDIIELLKTNFPQIHESLSSSISYPSDNIYYLKLCLIFVL